MSFKKNNALLTASLLALAALVCLGVGMRLLSTPETSLSATELTPPYQFASTLLITGGVVIFLLGAIALLAARRYALGAQQEPDSLPPELGLVDIQNWGQELVEIRDSLRHDLIADTETAEFSLHTLEVPDSWHPSEQYLIRPDGRPSDPLADLKKARERLHEAADRVDAIVQSINLLDTTDSKTTGCDTGNNSSRFWGFLLRKLRG